MAQYSLVVTPDTETLTVLVDGELRVIDDRHPNYREVREALDGDIEDADLRDLLDVSRALSRKFADVSDRVTLAGNEVRFDNEPVDTSLTRAILRFQRQGLPFRPLVAFFGNISLNPSAHSREQLYDWLRDREFTITDDGHFLAYKGVTDGHSVWAGRAVVDGVAHNGNIPNRVGSVIEMPRGEVQHDPSVGCAPGLHVATYEFASRYGNETLLVKVNPADVVSVPTDSQAQKVRVERYEVVEQVEDGSRDEPSYEEPALYSWDEPSWGEQDDLDDNEIVDSWEVASRSQPGVFYTLVEYADGRVECECPSYRYSVSDDCKHI